MIPTYSVNRLINIVFPSKIEGTDISVKQIVHTAHSSIISFLKVRNDFKSPTNSSAVIPSSPQTP